MSLLIPATKAQKATQRPRQVAPSRWLSITEHLDPRYGGICSVVPELCHAVNETGEFQLSLAGFCLPQESVPEFSGIETTRYPAGWGEWTNRSRREEFAERVSNLDGVHIHGLWREHCTLASWYARKSDRPYIISAHGMLDDWAVHTKRWKKAFYAALVERRNFENARCLHALTRAEAINYRQFGLRGPVAVIPNGISIPSNVSSNEFLQAYPNLRSSRIVLFLGRIHPKKGVDLLCRAWPAVRQRHADAHLVIAGPDCENSQSQLESLLDESGMTPHVTFTGMLRGSMKWSALASSEISILPSHSEGLSISILEAMAASRPVIVTRQCNMPEVATQLCGVEIEPRINDIAESVNALLGLPANQLAALGRNGQALARSRYSWTAVGAQMASLYRWAMSGAVPENVEFVE